MRALQADVSQADTAASLSLCRPTVSRIARQIESNPCLLEESATEIIERRAVGEIDTSRILETLLARRYKHGPARPQAGRDGYASGTLDEIQEAAGLDLLSDEEYETLVAAAAVR